MDDLKADISEFVDKYYDISLGQLQISNVFHDLTDISSKYRIILDHQLSLLGRVLAR